MKETILEEERVLPVLAVRGLVVFPGMIVQFDIGRKKIRSGRQSGAGYG